MKKQLIQIIYYKTFDFCLLNFAFWFRKAFLNDVIRCFGLILALLNAEDGFSEIFFNFAIILFVLSRVNFDFSTKSGTSKHFSCPSSERTHTRIK